LGRRLLSRVEEIMLNQKACCRVMCSIPTTRQSLLQWIGDRNYDCVKSIPYPFHGLNHVPMNEEAIEEVELSLWVKPLQSKTSSLAQSKSDIPNTIKSNNSNNNNESGNKPPAITLQPQTKGKIPLPPHWRLANLSTSNVIIPQSHGEETNGEEEGSRRGEENNVSKKEIEDDEVIGVD